MPDYDAQTVTKPGIEAPQAGAVQGVTNGLPVPVSFVASLGSPATVSTIGNTTVYTPTAGKRIRLKWVGLSSPTTNTATMLVTVLLGITPIYAWDMGAPGAFAHGTVREGAVNEVLSVTLSDSQTVRVNFDLVEF